MGSSLCSSCCNKRSTNRNSRNTVGVLPEKQLKVLLLGLMGSGKTEVGHAIGQTQRLDYESTNGVQCYRMQLSEGELAITEVGGNEEMQKIWHHYFVTTMGIIYCFDMSANYENLRGSFDLLRHTLSHPFVRGKPLLLVATKSDLASEGIQLYDIENSFQLESMANSFASSMHLCHFKGGQLSKSMEANENFTAGVAWLVKYLMENYSLLKLRVKYDGNMRNWQEQIKKLTAEGRLKRSRYQRFKHRLKNSGSKKAWHVLQTRQRSVYIRPNTAPAVVYSISLENVDSQKSASTATLLEELHEVPSTSAQALLRQNGNAVANLIK